MLRPQRFDLLLRGRRSLPLDLKQPEVAAFVLDLGAGANVLIEGFRPGVTERRGLARRNAWHATRACRPHPGWVQDGPRRRTSATT